MKTTWPTSRNQDAQYQKIVLLPNERIFERFPEEHIVSQSCSPAAMFGSDCMWEPK